MVATAVIGALSFADRPGHAQETAPNVVESAPSVTILAPSQDPAFSTASSSIDVSGVAEGGIAEVSWTNDRGGEGTAYGTTTWFASGIPLQPGVNELTVTARDPTGNTASARVRVVYELPVQRTTAPTSAPIAAPTFSIVAASTATAKTTTATTTADSPRPIQIAGTTSAIQSLDGLVAAYAFAEGSGTTVADASGNGNTGTLSGGVTWTSQGKFDKALEFHGSGFVTIPHKASLALASGMTLEAWVYPTVTPVSSSTAVVKEPAGEPAYALYAGSATRRPGARIRTSSAAVVNGPAMLPTHTWSHLAATFDGSTLRMYVDGTEVASEDVAGPIAASAGPLRIGGNAVSGEFFRGRIDNVRIYSRALSVGEIQADMATPVGPSGGMLGAWSAPLDWGSFVAVHMTLTHTGEVLMWDGQQFGPFSARLWDPATHVFDPAPNMPNIFCAGHCVLPDGRVFVAGGHNGAAYIGIRDLNFFDPTTGAWTAGPLMAQQRWYPTTTTLPNGKVLIVSGAVDCQTCIVDIPEIYDPATNTVEPLSNPSASLVIELYPHMFVLPDGRVLASANSEEPMISQVLDVDAESWTPVGSASPLNGGSSVMYRPGMVMKSGLGRNVDFDSAPAVKTTYVIDMTKPSPAWRQTAPMAFARTQHNLTILPDGSVLATGGGAVSDVQATDAAVLAAELWSPITETWTTMASMQVPRLYHSTALLLLDGRVLSAGGGRFGVDQPSAEIFSPPYLFKGSRPTITSVPSQVAYNASFTVQTPNAAAITAVSLIRAGSVTHAINMDQRFLGLNFQKGSGTLTVQAPANGNLAPPGYYLLFILDGNGVPSVASIIKVH